MEDPVKRKDVGPEFVPHRKRTIREDIELREVGRTDGAGVAQLVRRRSDEGPYEQEGQDESRDSNPRGTPNRWLRVDRPARRSRFVGARYADRGMPEQHQDDHGRRDYGGEQQGRSHPVRDRLEDATLGAPGNEGPIGKAAPSGERAGKPTAEDQHDREPRDPEPQGEPQAAT